MKIRAAVLERFGHPLEVQELELGEPRAGEVLVRLVACGVCHTDLYTASGADPSGYAPTVLGHEGAGVVELVGDGVASVSPASNLFLEIRVVPAAPFARLTDVLVLAPFPARDPAEGSSVGR